MSAMAQHRSTIRLKEALESRSLESSPSRHVPNASLCWCLHCSPPDLPSNSSSGSRVIHLAVAVPEGNTRFIYSPRYTFHVAGRPPLTLLTDATSSTFAGAACDALTPYSESSRPSSILIAGHSLCPTSRSPLCPAFIVVTWFLQPRWHISTPTTILTSDASTRYCAWKRVSAFATQAQEEAWIPGAEQECDRKTDLSEATCERADAFVSLK